MGNETTPFDGTADDRFTGVVDAFRANFATGLELGASLSVSIEGRNVIDVWGGWQDAERTIPWGRDTVACFFSSTKGVVALLALQLVDRGLLDLDAPVARYWPEFAQAGKETLPVKYLLTHEAGLSAIAKKMPFGSLSDWEAMTTALAEQAPWWVPGSGHGYHGVTYGHLIGEVIRRITGQTVGEVLREQLAGPLGVDLILGLPEAELHRTALMSMAPPTHGSFFDHWKPGDLGPKSFGNPPDGNDPNHSNTMRWLGAEIPAANGVGNARALDRMYAALACGGTLDGVRIIGPEWAAEAGRKQVEGMDLVMALPTAFSYGFEHTLPEWKFGPNPRTYGHNGSGGSLGLHDPDTGMSFGYVMNNMVWWPTRDDPRWAPIFDALYAAL